MSTFITEFLPSARVILKCQFEEEKRPPTGLCAGLAHGCLWLVVFGCSAHGLRAPLNAGVVVAICVLYLPGISCHS